MTKFEVGKTYSFERFCSEDGMLEFSVISRTEKTVVIDYQGEQNRRKIHTDKDGEYILPVGSYPYAPLGHSKDKEAKESTMMAEEIDEKKVEEEKKMTEMTAEQAIEEITKAETAEEIRKVLVKCSKRTMTVAYYELVGLPFYRNEDEMDATTLAQVIAKDIWSVIEWQRENF